MKVLALSPFDVDVVSGNVTTLQRIKAGMESRGHEFRILTVAPSMTAERVGRDLDEARPDVVHYYHAYKTGRLLPALLRYPSVLTLSGTDLNRDFHDADRRPVIEAALAEADRLLTYNRSLAEAASAHAPKLTLIAKGVTLGSAPYDLRAEAGCTPEDVVFLQAGGIRPVKNNVIAIEALAPLAGSLKLVFAGPLLDETYGREFASLLAGCPLASHLPNVPFTAMAAAWRAADVALNTSRSEGLSNSLMEAMATGTAVLAADIPGNRDLIENGVTGLLYADATDLREKARRLVGDSAHRRALAEAARIRASRDFSVDREIDAHVAAYRGAIGGIA